ncbi:hypothetical protein [Photobacterium carnosum]|jgi:hypothetical protein|uniref:hypothetical protein n=1 Tax=Photobacterium carnosum TaxID=2023717 RepID=UPI001E3BC031|nr:hypothetical protein [Photobacterium carnosum]MCD9513304.1 hypothetical protein [Photobacterium carnosum]
MTKITSFLLIIFSLFSTTILTGCATHGVVTIPIKAPIVNPEFDGKTFTTQLFYSQPEPGLFTAGKQLQLKPIEDAQLSVGASRVLSHFNSLFKIQLPEGSIFVNKGISDYTLIIELYAKDKFGPSYADYDALLSLGKSFLTLGLGSAEYTIIADFNITYKLKDSKGNILYKKDFSVNEKVDHEKDAFDHFAMGDDLASELLEKNIVLTMNDFFKSTI